MPVENAPVSEYRSGALFRSKLFGLVAPSLGWAPPLRYLLRRARILKLIRRLPPGQLIEVGCGAGALLDDFSSLRFDSVGLETSPAALAMAHLLAVHGGSGQIIVDNIDSTWEESKDVVCAFDVLEHIEDDAAALRQWVRWLRPDGWLVLSVPAHRRRWSPGDEWAGHWRRYDRSDIEALVRSCGLAIAHLECYGFPLANLTEWYGAKLYRRLLTERGKGVSKLEASANSGVERADASKLFRYVNTLPGQVALRMCLCIQAATTRTDWGSGYLLLVRRA